MPDLHSGSHFPPGHFPPGHFPEAPEGELNIAGCQHAHIAESIDVSQLHQIDEIASCIHSHNVQTIDTIQYTNIDIPNAVCSHIASQTTTSSRRTGTNEAILTYGGATRDYQEGQLSTWETLTTRTLTSGIGKLAITNLSDYFHAGETITWSGGSGVFIGWSSGKSLSSATIYLASPSGTPSGTVTGSSSGHTATAGTYSTGGCSPVLECYDDQDNYNDFVDLAGATTSTSYFRIIRPAIGHGHDGTPNNGVYFHIRTDNHGFLITENYSQVQDIIATLTITGTTNRSVFRAAGINSIIVGCIAWGSTISSADSTGIYLNGSNTKAINCLAIGNDGVGINIYLTTVVSAYVYNCTAINNGVKQFAFNASVGASGYWTNCLASGSTSGFWRTGTDNPTVNYCASSDLTADDWGGTGNRTGCTFSFVNSGNNDFHLLLTDAYAKNYGTDLSADAIYPFDDDIDRVRRSSGQWDIGLDEYGDTTIDLRVDIPLSISSAIHAHTADNVAKPVHVQTIESIASCIHNHNADRPLLSVRQMVDISSCIHSYTATDVGLLQDHRPSIADAIHNHTADSFALTQYMLGELNVYDAVHGHYVSEIELAQLQPVTISDSVHNFNADTVPVSQIQMVEISDAYHGHRTDEISVNLKATDIGISDAMHSHNVDSVDVIQLHVLNFYDSQHDHIAEDISIVVLETGVDFLTQIAGAVHPHFADALDLVVLQNITIPDAVHNHYAERIILGSGIDIIHPSVSPIATKRTFSRARTGYSITSTTKRSIANA